MNTHHILRRMGAWLLWIYPRAWRERYAAEMRALLDERPISLWTLADLLLSAADAHLNRRYLPTNPITPLEVFTMSQRRRTSAGAILLALALFVIAWVMVPFIGDTRATWEAVTTRQPAINYALLIFQLAGALALLTLLIGGAPLLGATIAQAWRERRGDLGWRLATPLALAIVVIAYSWFTVHNWWTRQPLAPLDQTPTTTALRLSFFALTFICGGLSAWAVASAINRAQPGDGVVRFTMIPAVIITIALSACLVALIALTALLFTHAPHLVSPAYLLPGFDALTLIACLIAGASVIRMAQPDPHPDVA